MEIIKLKNLKWHKDEPVKFRFGHPMFSAAPPCDGKGEGTYSSAIRFDNSWFVRIGKCNKPLYYDVEAEFKLVQNGNYTFPYIGHREFTTNNETKSNFEQFINTDESKQTINDTRLQETAEKVQIKLLNQFHQSQQSKPKH